MLLAHHGKPTNDRERSFRLPEGSFGRRPRSAGFQPVETRRMPIHASEKPLLSSSAVRLMQARRLRYEGNFAIRSCSIFTIC